VFWKRFRILSLLGFPVYLDLSWFVIAALIAWSLARGFFPAHLPDQSKTVYWIMGAAGAIGLFVSVTLHELAHALVARRFGLPIRGITLFIFGGVAEMDREPPSPVAEFWVAVAGPVASVLIAIACGLGAVSAGARVTAAGAILAYLGWVNGMLVAFNVIPAFPLDGGRILRSILWSWKNSLRWATRLTSRIGSGFGLFLIGVGVFWVLTQGDLVGGVWMFLIGMFLRNAAQMSYRSLVIRRALEGEPVRRFMEGDPVTVSRALPISDLVEQYVYRFHFKMFPVVDDGRLLGCVTTRQIRDVPRQEWGQQSVSSILEPCSEENTVGAESDAMEALAKMNRTGSSRLMVVQDDQLVGILALKDLLRFLSLKMELEGGPRVSSGD
jgi:Zn-dependent protease